MPACAYVTAAFFCFDPGDQLLGILRLKAGLAHDRHRHIGNAADGIEVVDHVVAKIVVERRRGRLCDMPDRHHVTVRGRFRDTCHTDRSARAADVLDHDLLTQRPAHQFRDQARHSVRRSARGRRHDQGNGTRREVLRRCLLDTGN